MVTALPYPHARNDCESCRERDADFQIAGQLVNRPDKRRARYCCRCIAEVL